MESTESPEGIEYHPAEIANSSVAAFLGGPGWTPKGIAEKAERKPLKENEE